MRAAPEGCDRELTAIGRVAPAARRAGLMSAVLASAVAIAAGALQASAPPRPAVAVDTAVPAPLAARLAVARGLGAAEPRFALERSRGGYRMRAGAGGGVVAEFGRGATEVRADGRERLTLVLSAIGRGETTRQLGAVSPQAAGTNRVQYTHPGVEEWFASGPLGLEQGFTLEHRPAGTGTLALTVGRLSPGTHARLTEGGNGLEVLTSSGRVSLRYADLSVSDASGRGLAASIGLSGRRIVLRVNDFGAQYPLRIDPLVEQAQLTSSAAGDTATLGQTMAMSGTTIVATEPGDTAYVFSEPSTGWATTSAASATLSAGGGQFGSDVAISGDTIAVGAATQTVGSNTDQGKVFVFTEPAGGWTGALTPSGTLIASDGDKNDELGKSLAMAGDTIVAAAPFRKVGTNVYQGALYVYTEPADGWSGTHGQSAELTVAGGTAGGDLGNPTFGEPILSMSGDTIVAGQCENTLGAYVFTMPSGGWSGSVTQSATLSETTSANTSAYIGCVLAISGGTIVAGSPMQSSAVTNPGTAYVYTEPNGGWSGTVTESAQLTESGLGNGNQFGYSVAASGDSVAVGAIYAGDNAQGTVYLYTRPAGGWSGLLNDPTVLADPSGGTGDQFGNEVAVDGDAVAVASEDYNGSQGAVYEFGPGGADDATSTGVTCVPNTVDAAAASTCTATVTDTAASGATAPGGTVTFGAAPGTFAFGDAAACTLQPNSASSSSCSVPLTPTAAGMYTVNASYGGETNHQPSSGIGLLTATGSATKPPPPPSKPLNTTRPTITGAAKAGTTLTCSHGTWTESPTTYAYAWAIYGTPIAGATGSTYTVQAGDEQLTITCTVTASNRAGAGAPATSNGLAIPVPKVKGCPAASGKLSGTTLGLVRLGMTPAQARHAYTHNSTRGSKYKDFFCLTPNGVRVGFGSPALLKTLPKAERKRYANRSCGSRPRARTSRSRASAPARPSRQPARRCTPSLRSTSGSTTGTWQRPAPRPRC